MISGTNNPHYAYGRKPSGSRKVRLRSHLLYRPLQLLLAKVPLPLCLLALLQLFWIFFDRHVTSRIYFAPPRPYVPPTESGPLSPFYGPPYDDYDGPTRAFPPRFLPCHSLSSERNFTNPASALKSGFFFLMQPQVASTTLAGVSSRIARNVAQRTRQDALSFNQTACATWAAPVKAKRLRNRIREKSFLWTMIREPVDRLVSKFFHYAVSIDGKEPTLKNFQAFLEANAYVEYGSYLKTMSLRRHVNPQRMDLVPTMVQEILDGYDFVGVLERLDESLAVLQLLLGLETQDMLYITTRSSDAPGGGSFHPLESKVPPKVTKCVKLQPTQVTLGWKKYLHQPYMYEEVFEPDIYMYKAMNASLDATIASLGHDKVEQTKRKLVWAQNQAQTKCAMQTAFPCSKEGQLQETTDCFVSDVGCGSPCLDVFGRSLANNVDFLERT